MIKLVNFLKINFILIIVCFFLPFFPYFSCESDKKSPSLADFTSVDTCCGTVDTIQFDTLKVNKKEVASPLPGSHSKRFLDSQTDSHLHNEKSGIQSILDYLSFTKYKTDESDISITGFG